MGLLVYPPLEHTTDSPSIFFIGSAQNYCKINSQTIDLIHAGNFCPVFDLDLGENIFEVEIDSEKFIYKIRRLDHHPTLRSGQAFLTNELSLKPKKFQKICIDAGHGGSARGTCSPKGLAEKDLNLSFAKLLYSELKTNGFEVLLTRDSDIDLSLTERVNKSKEFGANFFISIHHNAIPDNQNPLEHQGISAHYYYKHSEKYADELLTEILGFTQLKNAGIIRQNLHVLRENPNTLSVLLELGYLIHPIESETITKPEFQEKAVKGISKFFKNHLGG